MEIKESLAVSLKKELGSLREAVGNMLSQFREMHSPIRESQERVPLASKQLRKITAETEAATNRVLDVAEGITTREAALIAELVALQAGAAPWGEEIANKIISCRNLAEQNHNDAFSIMEALQFQDITAQQMNHTMDLLEDIENRLNALLSVLGGGKPPVPANGKEQSKTKVAYDPNAKFDLNQAGHQDDIDSLINAYRSKS